MMANMARSWPTTLEDAGAKYNEFVRSLQASLDVINRNRSELQPQLGGAAPVQETAPTESVSLDDDDLDDSMNKIARRPVSRKLTIFAHM